MNRKRRSPAERVCTGLTAGLVGGLIASFVMNQFQSGLSKLTQPEQDGQPQQAAGNDEGSDDATMKTADALATSVLHRRLTQEEKEQAASFVHYAFGGTMGAVYGVLAELNPAASRGFGLPFATVLWLAADEVAVPALGLARKPTEYPVSTHASALASHLVYGLSTDLVRRGIAGAFHRR